MRQGDVGDRGIEHLHEGRNGDSKRDEPGIMARLPVMLIGRHIRFLIYSISKLISMVESKKDRRAKETRECVKAMRRLFIEIKGRLEENQRGEGVTLSQVRLLH